MRKRDRASKYLIFFLIFISNQLIIKNLIQKTFQIKLNPLIFQKHKTKIQSFPFHNDVLLVFSDSILKIIFFFFF